MIRGEICGSGGGTYRERASSAEYLRITSPFSSWYSRSETRMMSPLLIQIFFRSLPRIRPRRLTPSKHYRRPVSGLCHFLCFRVEISYHGLKSAVAQHLENLGVLLSFLLEVQLALLITIASVSDVAIHEHVGKRRLRTRSRSFPCGGSCHPFPCSSAC